jgi:hypothetical protein
MRWVLGIDIKTEMTAGHVVHSGASGAQNIDALLFLLWWTWALSLKSVPGHVMPNLCFCIPEDLWVT